MQIVRDSNFLDLCVFLVFFLNCGQADSDCMYPIIKVLRDRSVVAQLVKRAEKAGFKAIVLTVDTPRIGRREADIKNR